MEFCRSRQALSRNAFIHSVLTTAIVAIDADTAKNSSSMFESANAKNSSSMFEIANESQRDEYSSTGDDGKMSQHRYALPKKPIYPAMLWYQAEGKYLIEGVKSTEVMRWANDTFETLPSRVRKKYEETFKRQYALYRNASETRQKLQGDIRMLKKSFSSIPTRSRGSLGKNASPLLEPMPEIAEIERAILRHPLPAVRSVYLLSEEPLHRINAIQIDGMPWELVEIYAAVQTSTDLDGFLSDIVGKLRRSISDSRKFKQWKIETLLDPPPSMEETKAALRRCFSKDSIFTRKDITRVRSAVMSTDLDESTHADTGRLRKSISQSRNRQRRIFETGRDHSYSVSARAAVKTAGSEEKSRVSQEIERERRLDELREPFHTIVIPYQPRRDAVLKKWNLTEDDICQPTARHIAQLHKWCNVRCNLCNVSVYDKKRGFCCAHPVLPITDPEQRELFLREFHDAIAADAASAMASDVTTLQREIPFEDYSVWRKFHLNEGEPGEQVNV